MPAPDDIPRSKPLALTGVLLLSAPLFSTIFTIIAMVRAFGRLKEAGAADPNMLAGDIGLALDASMVGIVIGLVGIVLVNIALFTRANREQWFYRSVLVLSVIWCILFFPLGLIPGFFLNHQFRKRRDEFSR